MKYIKLFESFESNEYYEKINMVDCMEQIEPGFEKDAQAKLEKRATELSSKIPEASITLHVQGTSKHFGTTVKELPSMKAREHDLDSMLHLMTVAKYSRLEKSAPAIIDVVVPITNDEMSRITTDGYDGLALHKSKNKNREFSMFFKVRVLITYHSQSYFNAIVKSELDVLATQPAKFLSRKKEFIARNNTRYDFFKCDSLRSISVLISNIFKDKEKYCKDLFSGKGDKLSVVIDSREEFLD